MPAPAAPHPASAPRPRAVLLGASNLIHGLPSAVAAARRALGGGPIEALAATGHGRSYGVWSSAGVRGLPGILDCGLWAALDRAGATAPGVRTVALLTDVGNDIGYGHPPATVARWVAECAARLAAAGATTVVTRLPLATLSRLPPWRFRLVAALLFPGRRHDFGEVLRRAEELDRRLVELAARDGLRLAALDPEWYRAWDAIHLRFRRLPAAWATAFGERGLDPPAPEDGGGAPGSNRPAGVRATANAPRAAAEDPPGHLGGMADRPGRPGRGALPPGDRLRILLARPERYTLAGVALRAPQPAVRLGDGTTVSLF